MSVAAEVITALGGLGGAGGTVSGSGGAIVGNRTNAINND